MSPPVPRHRTVRPAVLGSSVQRTAAFGYPSNRSSAIRCRIIVGGLVLLCDSARVWRLAEELEAGVLGVDTGLVSTAVAPLGGVKESGLGREGALFGVEGMA